MYNQYITQQTQMPTTNKNTKVNIKDTNGTPYYIKQTYST